MCQVTLAELLPSCGRLVTGQTTISIKTEASIGANVNDVNLRSNSGFEGGAFLLRLQYKGKGLNSLATVLSQILLLFEFETCTHRDKQCIRSLALSEVPQPCTMKLDRKLSVEL